MAPIYARLVTSSTTSKKNEGSTLKESTLAQNPVILEQVLLYLDFHDVSQLLKTGTSSLRLQLLEFTREVYIGRLGPYTSTQETIVPRNILSLLSAFQSLETVSLISPSVVIPVGKTSPFLELSPTLQHLTISTKVCEVKFIPRLVEIPWSVHFPFLQTLRLGVTAPHEDRTRPMPLTKLHIEKMSLPSTLRVLSLLLPNIKNYMKVINDICHPIGYKLKAHKKITAQDHLTWTSLFNSHSDSDRRNFAWLLPNLRFLEMTSSSEIFEHRLWLDLSILPPLLETIRTCERFPCFTDVRSYSKPVDPLECVKPEISESASVSTPPSSLRTLAVEYATAEMLQACPPSLTRIMVVGNPQTDLNQLFPNRVHSACREKDDTFGAQLRSLFWSLHASFPPKLPEHLTELSVFIRRREPSLWELPKMLPEGSQIRTLKFSGSNLQNPTLGDDYLTQFHHRLSGLTSLHLGLTFGSTPDLMAHMPRTLTKMVIVHIAVVNSEFKLKGTPPLLTSLHASSDATTYVTPEELQYLPKGMKHLFLPPIRVEANPRQNPALNPALEIDFDTKLLPPDCECFLSFIQQGPLLPLSWQNLPSSIRDRITLTPIPTRPDHLFISAEDEFEM